jgi:hypothetical protein
MYSNPYSDIFDPDVEEVADEIAELQAQIAVEKAATEKLKAQAAQMERKLAEAKERDAKTAPKAPAKPAAPDFARLDAELAKVAPNDFAAAIRALDRAGVTTVDPLNQQWRGGQLQQSGGQQRNAEQVYAYVDQATSFEEFERRLAEVGLIEGTS